MLKIHTSDGMTSHIDLSDEQQARDWLKRLRDQDFQRAITGATIIQKTHGRFKCPKCTSTGRFQCPKCGRLDNEYNGQSVQYSLARPEGFQQIFYLAEGIEPDEQARIKGGEKITCFVDDIRVTVMVHRSQPSVRIALLKTGKQRYNPYSSAKVGEVPQEE